MSAHTPAPWMFMRNATTHSFRIESETLLIARMVGTGDESDANAKLIAAAPDLAEAMGSLLDAMEMQEGREAETLHINQPTAKKIWVDAKDKARAALQKAGL